MSEKLITPPKRQRSNLKREVETFIRDLIHSGQVKPGVRLDQDKIAETLGVSRLPVREALITLESEGLVENIARRGSFVAQIEPEDILDHYSMFGVISGLAAARVAVKDNGEIVSRLRSLNEEMRKATDPVHHDELNYLFHQTINRAGGSRRLTAVLKSLSASMPSDYFQHNNEWGFRNQALNEHDQILEAIQSGDAARASSTLQKHFDNTGRQAVKMLSEAGFWDKNE